MESLINLGAVVVVPSGNHGERNPFVDTVPAVFASPAEIPDRPSLPLIVAGAVDNNGALPLWSQSSLAAMAWAPGVKVVCTKRGWSSRSTETGTSFSAGMVCKVSLLV